MSQTDLDKLVGAQPEDIVPKHQQGTFRDRAAEMPADESVAVKALPMKKMEAPFKITGGGDGG